jgi:hypothetical protein
MQDVKDFQGLIDLWPSARAFARDVAGEEHQELGRIWRRRNRVPREHWPRLLPLVVDLAPDAFNDGESEKEFLERLYRAGRGEGR